MGSVCVVCLCLISYYMLTDWVTVHSLMYSWLFTSVVGMNVLRFLHKSFKVLISIPMHWIDCVWFSGYSSSSHCHVSSEHPDDREGTEHGNGYNGTSKAAPAHSRMCCSGAASVWIQNHTLRVVWHSLTPLCVRHPVLAYFSSAFLSSCRVTPVAWCGCFGVVNSGSTVTQSCTLLS